MHSYMANVEDLEVLHEYNRIQQCFYVYDRLAVKLSKHCPCIHRAYFCIIFIMVNANELGGFSLRQPHLVITIVYVLN